VHKMRRPDRNAAHWREAALYQRLHHASMFSHQSRSL